MVDLRVLLEEAGAAVERNLSAMHRRGQYILGPESVAFEEEFAREVGGAAAFAVGTGSGTAALELCLRDAEIGAVAGKPADEVVIPSMTSLFTAQAVLAAGARLRVADVSPEDLLLTPAAVEKAFTPNTRAVIAVHLYGQPCDLSALSDICRRRGVTLIQDACQAHGARSRGLPLTAYSSYCAYSFYPTKTLGCLGDGGAVVTGDSEIAARLRLLRDGGRLGDQQCRRPGLNSRLDEIQACYLRAFLPFLQVWNQRRREQAAIYKARLAQLETLRLVEWDSESVHHLCVVRSPRRDALREFLGKRGIQTAIHYPIAIEDQPGLQPFSSYAEAPRHGGQAAQEVLSIPLGPHLSNEHIHRVAAAIEAFE